MGGAVSAGADTKANTRWPVRGCGVLELLDLRLFEDCGELGDALISDVIDRETAKEGWSEDGERAGVSAGPDTKANASESVRVPKQPTRATAAWSCL